MMIRKMKETTTLRCSTCNTEHPIGTDPVECGLCGDSGCSKCKDNVLDIEEEFLHNLLMGDSIYHLCKTCRSMIESTWVKQIKEWNDWIAHRKKAMKGM